MGWCQGWNWLHWKRPECSKQSLNMNWHRLFPDLVSELTVPLPEQSFSSGSLANDLTCLWWTRSNPSHRGGLYRLQNTSKGHCESRVVKVLLMAEGAEGTADPSSESPAEQSWQSAKSDQPTHNKGQRAIQQTGSSSGCREVSESWNISHGLPGGMTLIWITGRALRFKPKSEHSLVFGWWVILSSLHYY